MADKGKEKPKRRGRGRPSVWEDPAVEQSVIESFEVGMSVYWAAQRAGIDESTLEKRLREDRDFSCRCNRARGEGVFFHASRLRTTDESAHVAASKHFLATRARDRWSDKQPEIHVHQEAPKAPPRTITVSLDQRKGLEVEAPTGGNGQGASGSNGSGNGSHA